MSYRPYYYDKSALQSPFLRSFQVRPWGQRTPSGTSGRQRCRALPVQSGFQDFQSSALQSEMQQVNAVQPYRMFELQACRFGERSQIFRPSSRSVLLGGNLPHCTPAWLSTTSTRMRGTLLLPGVSTLPLQLFFADLGTLSLQGDTRATSYDISFGARRRRILATAIVLYSTIL